jgi:hypothetical protein
VEVRCYTEFDLKGTEEIALVPEPNRDDLINWLKLVPIRATIRCDYMSKSKIVAYWTEER